MAEIRQKAPSQRAVVPDKHDTYYLAPPDQAAVFKRSGNAFAPSCEGEGNRGAGSKITDDGGDHGPQKRAEDQGQSEGISKRPGSGRGGLFRFAVIIGGSLGTHCGRPRGSAVRVSAALQATQIAVFQEQPRLPNLRLIYHERQGLQMWDGGRGAASTIKFGHVPIFAAIKIAAIRNSVSLPGLLHRTTQQTWWMPNSSPTLSRDMVLLSCAAGAIALLTFPLAMPVHDFDRGIFVSVAERLLAGDRLYAQVWDNKGPLFYYLVALERYAGSAAEILAELLLLLLASYSAFRLVAVFSCLRNAVLAGLIGGPIILTGVYYFPGYSHLPAISFSFAALALAAQGRMVWSGLVLGLVPFANILVFPVAAPSVLALCWHRRNAALFVGLAQGFFLSVALFTALLFQRGELQPFLDSILQNFAYSQGSLVRGEGVMGHLVSHLSLINFNRAKIIAALICACLLYGWLRKETGGVHPLLLTAAISFAASAAVLATTGLWRQHLQLLSIPGILSASAALICAPTFPLPARLCVMVILSWILSGAANPARYGEAISHFATGWKSLNAAPKDATAIAASSSPGVYARLGKNDDHGHAIGLSKWKLGCARFHQYPFDTEDNLKRTLACAAGADTLLVTPSFAPEEGQPGWNRFVADGEKLLSSAFHCRYRETLRLCRRIPRT